jgi:prolipoprotein diacylglyceryltransferase
VLDRFFRFRPPALFALYVVMYTGFRFFLEFLRVDPSGELFGVRTNALVAAVVFILAMMWFIWAQFMRDDDPHVRQRERKVEPPPTMSVPRGRVRPRG